MGSEVLEAVESHLKDTAPIECVGLILWDGTVLRLKNQAQSEHRFFVSGQQLEERLPPDMPVMAIYHSHPHREAEPSGEDREHMLYLLEVWPSVFHIILSPHGHRAYHVVDGDIEERNLPW
jgi:proteasome lid subunit RPN8/RPN11